MRFNIETFKKKVAPLDLDGIDFDAFRQQPLDESVLRCLRYMHDVEHHTVCYLRDVLVTDAHRDPDITAFLTFWVFEEFWHGEALGKVLEAHREPGSHERVRATRQRVGRHDKLMPIYTMVANRMTRHVPAVHMAWGAINELTTLTGYRRLADLVDHPILHELLDRIVRDESRHFYFYYKQAAQRLERPLTARVARALVERFWAPVGSGVQPATETRFLARYLFTGGDGRAAARKVDATIRELPGFGGVPLLEAWIDRADRRPAPPDPTWSYSRSITPRNSAQ